MLTALFRPYEFHALLPLARARYPDVDPLLAVDFFLSDRRAAGLGALGKRPLRWRAIGREKRQDLMTGRIDYRLWGDVPARQVFEAPVVPLRDLLSMPIDDPSTFVATVRTVPGRFIERCVRVEARDMHTARGRKIAARYLREARRQMREDAP